MKKTVCIYHGNCLDGFTSAWIVHSALDSFRDLSFIKGSYGTPIDLTAIKDAEVIFVDFSVKHDAMLEIAKVAHTVLVLDHHVSAERELQDLPANVTVKFDMDRSGAMITWDHYSSSEAPTLVKIVQDRDLWLFKNQYTKPLTAYMFTLPQTFTAWDKLLDDVNSGKAIDMGQVLLDAHNKNVADIIDGCTRKVMISGHVVNMTNAHWMYASDIGHLTIGDDAKFSVTYFVDKDGGYKYSLRANDEFDCTALAETYGGGGHPNASGFSSTLPVWQEVTDER